MHEKQLQNDKFCIARLARIDVGRAKMCGGAIEIAGPYSERRLPAIRDLPERRFDAERKIWTVPLTRAGAHALLALADELVTTQRARDALARAAMPAGSSARPELSNTGPGPAKRSPIAHWRHYTSGPVFDNPARERIHVPGLGICIRVRVNPSGGRGD